MDSTSLALDSVSADNIVTLHVYKASLPSVNYIFKNGKPAIFISGVFRTNIPWEIEELDAEIKAGHPHIFVDKNEVTVQSNQLDPLYALREKIIAEFLAKSHAATDINNDMGSTVSEPLKPSNTTQVTSAAGGPGLQILKAASAKV